MKLSSRCLMFRRRSAALMVGSGSAPRPRAMDRKLPDAGPPCPKVTVLKTLIGLNQASVPCQLLVEGGCGMQYDSLQTGAIYRTRHLLLALCNQGVVGSNPIRSMQLASHRVCCMRRVVFPAAVLVLFASCVSTDHFAPIQSILASETP